LASASGRFIKVISLIRGAGRQQNPAGIVSQLRTCRWRCCIRKSSPSSIEVRKQNPAIKNFSPSRFRFRRVMPECADGTESESPCRAHSQGRPSAFCRALIRASSRTSRRALPMPTPSSSKWCWDDGPEAPSMRPLRQRCRRLSVRWSLTRRSAWLDGSPSVWVLYAGAGWPSSGAAA
jgi:hypothetical protein